MMKDAKMQLTAARTRLILDKPFIGTLVLRLPLVEGDPIWCETAATDAKKFYYNKTYIESLNTSQVEFILAHEALHCALSHFARRQHRLKHLWDLACDYAINPLLVSEGLDKPPGVWIEDSFEGMTAEEIYPYIKENTDEMPLDKHIYDQQDQQQNRGHSKLPASNQHPSSENHSNHQP